MTHRFRGLLPLLAVLGTLLAGCGGSDGGVASGPPPGFYGVIAQGGPLSKQAFQKMGRGSVGTLRSLVQWGAVQPQAGVCCNWSSVDFKVGAAAANGIQTLPYVYGTPGWVDNPGVAPITTKADQRAWKGFLTAFVQRYGPGGTYWTDPSLYQAQHPDATPVPVKAVQIWNEQNSPVFWHPRPDPAQYGQLLKISHDAIQAADPSIKILDGGMFFSPDKPTAIHADRFLQRLYEIKGVKQAFDIAAIHPYAGDIGGVQAQIELMRKVMKKAGDGSKQLWVTEIGWSSRGPKTNQLIKNPTEQAQLLTKAFTLVTDRREQWRIAGVIWYSWQDVSKSQAPCQFCYGSGLLSTDGKPKPAWRAFERFAR
jgi:polysaccharide biosynthesis protein PslG